MTDKTPAFPCGLQSGHIQPLHSGISIRDYFAAKAMQGMLADPDTARTIQKARRKMDEAVAELSYMYADAMMEARK